MKAAPRGSREISPSGSREFARHEISQAHLSIEIIRNLRNLEECRALDPLARALQSLATRHRQEPTSKENNHNSKNVMPKFIIERNIPNAGQWSARELREASARSCRVLHEMGPEVQWVQSYVTGDKLFCVYHAANAELIREHGLRASVPVDAIHQVATIIDPATAE